MTSGLAPDTHVLVMAGGSGTRFWPKSRASRPKQLLALWDERTLLEHTVARFAGQVSQENIWIVTAQSLVEPSRKALAGKFEKVRYLGEPVGRNTAPCILWGVREISKVNPDAVVAVVPADSYIGDERAYLAATGEALAHARGAGDLVTLGVKPTRPETGYGYIEAGAAPAATRGEWGALAVRRFVEKPDAKTAVGYFEGGRHLWNAGMFFFMAETGLAAFRATMPALFGLFESGAPVAELYPRIDARDAVSVDYGVMERAAAKGIPVAVVPVDCGWNDVGSFAALEEIGRGVSGQVVELDASGNVVQSDRGLVALLGVKDLVIVRDGDAVLVCAKERAQDIRGLVEKVRRARADLV